VEERRFVVEGVTLVQEALAAGAAIESVLVDVAASSSVRELATACAQAGARLIELQPGVLARASATVTPQPIAAIVETVDIGLAELGRHSPTWLLICVDVRDPGNVGTILRSAGAAGAGGVVCCSGAVDVYNPKTVRSSAGVLFHLPVVAGGDAAEVLDEVARWGLRRWGTAARGGRDYAEVDMTGPMALVLGNESHGLGDLLAGHLDGTLTIPMPGPAESLNVAMTAAVLCFEAARQRRLAGRVGGAA
jgi:TrmH family RNA methyltransferase